MPSCLLLQLPSLVGPVVLTQVFFLLEKRNPYNVFSLSFLKSISYMRELLLLLPQLLRPVFMSHIECIEWD